MRGAQAASEEVSRCIRSCTSAWHLAVRPVARMQQQEQPGLHAGAVVAGRQLATTMQHTVFEANTYVGRQAMLRTAAQQNRSHWTLEMILCMTG